MIGWNIAFARALRATNLSKRAKKIRPICFPHVTSFPEILPHLPTKFHSQQMFTLTLFLLLLGPALLKKDQELTSPAKCAGAPVSARNAFQNGRLRDEAQNIGHQTPQSLAIMLAITNSDTLSRWPTNIYKMH